MLEFVDLDHAQELDAYVYHHPNCHFIQSSLWGRVKSDWGWQGLLYRDALGVIRGSMALLTRKVRYGKSCLLYAPRGPIYDDEAALQALLDGARRLGKERNAYLLRIDPMVAEDTEIAGFRCSKATDFSLFQPRMCYVLDLQGLTEEALVEGYRSSTRRKVRLAQRSGVSIELGGEADLPEFCEMMKETAAKNGFTPRELPYFQSLLRGMGSNARLYLAKKDGRYLAAAIAAFYGNRAWYLYGCSHRNGLSMHPNELLQWKMQTDALAMGCRYFDLRGAEGYPDMDNPKLGLHQYKQGFGAHFCAYGGQYDMVLRPFTALCCRIVALLRR